MFKDDSPAGTNEIYVQTSLEGSTSEQGVVTAASVAQVEVPQDLIEN